MESDSDDSDSNTIHCKTNILKQSKFKSVVILDLFNNCQKIGYIKGILINARDIYKELNSDEVLKIFESDDKEEEEEMQSFYMCVLSKKDCKDHAFYITEFFLEKEFRGGGMGTIIMNNIKHLLLSNISNRISCVYLMPGPLEKVNGQVAYVMNNRDSKMIALKNKLINFYTSVGFKQINTTEFFKEQIC